MEHGSTFGRRYFGSCSQPLSDLVRPAKGERDEAVAVSLARPDEDGGLRYLQLTNALSAPDQRPLNRHILVRVVGRLPGKLHINFLEEGGMTVRTQPGRLEAGGGGLL